MANTTFIDGVTKIVSSWLQDVNDFVYLLGASKSDLASTSDASKGAGMSGINGELEYQTGTVGDALTATVVYVGMEPWRAKGDAVTDDTIAIQSAINSIESGTVKLKPGATHIVSSLSLKTGVSLDINGATLKQKNGTDNSPIVQCSGSSRVNVLNGSIDGNKTSVTGNLAGGLQFVGCSNISVSNIEFSNVRRICANFDSSTNVNILNISGASAGVSGLTTGMLIQIVNGCSRVNIENASISVSYGVGALIRGSRDISIKNYSATNISGDNGFSADTCSNMSMENITTIGCGNQGVEISSTNNLTLKNIESTGNGVYGLMISTFTGGTEAACIGVDLSGLKTSGNGANGLRIIGAQYVNASQLNVSDSANVLNSGGGIAAKFIAFDGGYVNLLTLTGGTNIRINDCDVTTLNRVGALYTWHDSRRQPITGAYTNTLPNGGSIDLHIPSTPSRPFNGLLIVGSYFVTNPSDQNTSAIYHLSQFASTQVTSISVVSGATPRQVVATIPSENIVRLTNSTGVDCIVSSTFVGSTS